MSKVVNIFEAKKKKENENDELDLESFFKDAIERNKKATEKLARERAQDNKNVLKRFRIKE